MGAAFSGYLEVVQPTSAWEMIARLAPDVVLVLAPDNAIHATLCSGMVVRLNEDTLKWEAVEMSENPT